MRKTSSSPSNRDSSQPNTFCRRSTIFFRIDHRLTPKLYAHFSLRRPRSLAFSTKANLYESRLTRQALLSRCNLRKLPQFKRDAEVKCWNRSRGSTQSFQPLSRKAQASSTSSAAVVVSLLKPGVEGLPDRSPDAHSRWQHTCLYRLSPCLLPFPFERSFWGSFAQRMILSF